MSTIPFNTVLSGVSRFLDEELMPMLGEKSWKRVVYGAAISIYLSKSETIISQLKTNPMVAALGVIGEDNSIDIETLYPIIEEQVGKNGMEVDIPGVGVVTFKKEDVKRLYDYITTANKSKKGE